MESSLKAQAIIVVIKAVPADGMSAAAVKRASARPIGQLAINVHDIPHCVTKREAAVTVPSPLCGRGQLGGSEKMNG
jgi:hypothetical protein